MKRTATSSERSSTGVAGRPHLDGRLLEYERGKQEGKDETEEEIPCDIYVLRFSLGLGDEMRSTGIGCERWTQLTSDGFQQVCLPGTET
jgi:hypothetical protein